jgi:transcriptional regulator with XRE-family HTH domain
MEAAKPIRKPDGRVDWQLVLVTLQKRGMTQTEIADQCGTKQGTIGDILHGRTSEPRYALGESLLDLLMSVGDNTEAA